MLLELNIMLFYHFFDLSETKTIFFIEIFIIVARCMFYSCDLCAPPPR